MAEALELVLKFAFEDVRLHRIHAKHDIQNPNSGKVMKKCGMKFLETKMAPLALKSETSVMCSCYEILNKNI